MQPGINKHTNNKTQTKIRVSDGNTIKTQITETSTYKCIQIHKRVKHHLSYNSGNHTQQGSSLYEHRMNQRYDVSTHYQQDDR